MRKGKEIMAWNEPRAWRLAAKEYAKAEGIRMLPIKECLSAFAMVGGLLFYKWSEADPEKRPSPLGLVIVFLALCTVLFALVRLKLALNKTRTSLRENGMWHGPLDSRRWIPYGTIQVFTIEEDECDGRRFRFLVWFEEHLEEECHSVLPETLDPRGVIEILKSKGVEHRVTLDEAE
jgi:hypothetical protein